MNRNLVMLAAAICIGTAASDAGAHHSHPYTYDQCKSITLEGRVDSVEWKDPHTWIVLRVDEGTAYTIDWSGMSQLKNNRVLDSAKAALVSGARIAVTGNPIRTAAEIREQFPDYKYDVNPRTVDPRSIRRVDDSFNWVRRADSMSPDCNRK